MIDVVVAGAGPAGLSAALCLARSGRTVLVLDAGPWRNASADRLHNVFSRDGVTPAGLRSEALAQLGRYDTVRVQAGSATAVQGSRGDFRVDTDTGQMVSCRRVVLATGIEDLLPDIPGLADRWGVSVLHCPYCHGWEHLGERLGVLACDMWSVHQALQIARFSDEVVLCTNGRPDAAGDDQRRQLKARGVSVRDEPIVGLEGDGTGLELLRFADGNSAPCQALFCHTPWRQRSDLPAQLGCTLTPDRSVQVDQFGQTTVAGVFAVGDMAHDPAQLMPTHNVTVAAARGLTAALLIDQELLYEE